MSSATNPCREIAVFGPGLLGGSLALALKNQGRVRLWGRRAEAIVEARRLQMADICTTDLEEAVSGADLVVFCTPIETMLSLANQIRPFLSPSVCITDVGSAKAGVVTDLEAVFGPEVFLGSHPMAGAEQSGLSAARADLFNGASCIVTPTEKTSSALMDCITAFWEKLGCRVFSLSPETHDRQIGLVSHLPHLLAGCLVNAVSQQDADSLALVGQGFRDSTRIASGPPEMWTGILLANRDAMLEALNLMQGKIAQATQLLQSENDEGLRKFLRTAKITRDGIVRKVRIETSSGE